MARTTLLIHIFTQDIFPLCEIPVRDMHLAPLMGYTWISRHYDTERGLWGKANWGPTEHLMYTKSIPWKPIFVDRLWHEQKKTPFICEICMREAHNQGTLK